MKYSYTHGFNGQRRRRITLAVQSTTSRICVMHVITGLYTGGAETMLFKLLSGANKDRYQNIVVALRSGGPMQEKFESLGIEVFNLQMSGYLQTLSGLLKLRLYIRRYKPHVIQGWMYHGNIVATLAKVLSFRNTPVAWNIRHALHDFHRKKFMTAVIIRAGVWLSFIPARIVYNSITSAKQHQKLGYSQSRTQLLPNGFNCEQFRPSSAAREKLRSKLNLAENTRIIGLVARYHPIKDFNNFIEAAAKLSTKYNNIHFVLVGTNVNYENIELMNLINKYELRNRLHLLGEQTDIAEITAGFDVATSSSWSEAFPNTIGEAMSCGVPCVVTNVGDSAVIVADTGKVVSPKDPDELAAGWEEILELNQEERLKLGMAARKRVVDKYSLAAIVEQYETLYAEIACQAGKYSGSKSQIGEFH